MKSTAERIYCSVLFDYLILFTAIFAVFFCNEDNMDYTFITDTELP